MVGEPCQFRGLDKKGCALINWIPICVLSKIQGKLWKYKERLELFVITFGSLLDFLSCDFIQRTDHVGALPFIRITYKMFSISLDDYIKFTAIELSSFKQSVPQA